MAKPPPEIPTEVGQRVVMRANTNRPGTLRVLSPQLWCWVDWDDGDPSIKIVHQYELRTTTA